jgi:glucose-1-phosphate adenylyltransferase
VRVHSFCEEDHALLVPEVTVRRNCRLSRVVVDRGCKLPEGLVIGEDAELDAQRFERSPGGVVLVTRDMLNRLPTSQP